jgi:hypothetical protein
MGIGIASYDALDNIDGASDGRTIGGPEGALGGALDGALTLKWGLDNTATGASEGTHQARVTK